MSSRADLFPAPSTDSVGLFDAENTPSNTLIWPAEHCRGTFSGLYPHGQILPFPMGCERGRLGLWKRNAEDDVAHGGGGAGGLNGIT